MSAFAARVRLHVLRRRRPHLPPDLRSVVAGGSADLPDALPQFGPQRAVGILGHRHARGGCIYQPLRPRCQFRRRADRGDDAGANKRESRDPRRLRRALPRAAAELPADPRGLRAGAGAVARTHGTIHPANVDGDRCSRADPARRRSARGVAAGGADGQGAAAGAGDRPAAGGGSRRRVSRPGGRRHAGLASDAHPVAVGCRPRTGRRGRR